MTKFALFVVAFAASLSITNGPGASAQAKKGKPQQPQTLTTQQLYEKLSRSVVTITADNRTGTGFFGPDSTLFTAYHVVKGATSVKVTLSDGSTYKVSRYVGIDEERDIAALCADDLGRSSNGRIPRLVPRSILEPAPFEFWIPNYAVKDRPALQFSEETGTEKVGDEVFTIGSPLGLTGTLTEGIISARRTWHDADILQLTAGVSPGSSGSPVFNVRGQVIGIILSRMVEGETLNFAVSSYHLRQIWGVPMANR